MLSFPWTILAALPVLVSAGIEFTSPKAGATITAGTVSASINFEWKDGGEGPPIANLKDYEVSLWAGSNDQNMQIIQLVKPTTEFTLTGNQGSAAVSVALGGNVKNAYFLKMIAVGKTGGQLVTFSPRFTISGMTGNFVANIDAAAKTVGDKTDGPPTTDGTTNPVANPADGDFGIAYTMQTGATRYAPMQPVPPTKITQKKPTPAYPTSAIQTIATTFLPIPKQRTTMTKVQTFSVSSRENTAAPAPHPTDDMAKFLARWKD